MTIRIEIPGFRILELDHLVLDYNGTIAVGGKPVVGVHERARALAKKLSVHVLTADTFGTAADALAGFPCELHVIARKAQDLAKLRFVQRLGADRACAVGNGRNDRRMVKAAALGIAVVEGEGAASETLIVADVSVRSVIDAFDLLLHPLRLVATLRS